MSGLNVQTTTSLGAELAWAVLLSESVADVAWAPEGDVLYAGAADGWFYAYQADGETRFRTRAHQDGITRVRPSPAGDRVVTAGEDGALVLWSAATGDMLQTLALDSEWAEHVAWSADGTLLAGAAGKRIYVRDAQGKVETWDGHPGNVGALAWTRSGQRLASATNKGVYLWNVGAWNPVRVLEFPGAAISLAWSGNGQALAAGTQDGFLYVRIQAPGATPRQLNMSGYPGKVSVVCWDPRSMRIATCGGNDVVLWDVDPRSDRRRATPLRRHSQTVTALAYNSSGSLLASGDRLGRLCIWDPQQALVCEMELGSEITVLAWQPEFDQLAVGTVDGVLRLFSLVGNAL